MAKRIWSASSVAPPQNLTVGEPLRAIVPPAVSRDAGMMLVDPAGEEHLLSVREEDGRLLIEFEDTHLPGIYKLVPAEQAPESRMGAQLFALNFDRREGDLEALPAESLQAVADEFGARIVRSGAEYAALDRVRRFGQEIWRPLLMAVLVLLFGEILLQQWMSRRTL